MKSHAMTMLEVSAVVLLFLGACWHVYESYSRADQAIETAYAFSQDQSRAVETLDTTGALDRADIPAAGSEMKRSYQGSEVMYMISGEERRYEITVNGTTVPESLDPDLGDWEGWPTVQPAARYESSPIYSSGGMLVRIDFIKVR